LSVTFAAEQDTVQFQLTCSCGEVKLSQVFDTYQEAMDVYPSVVSTCDDEYCRAWPVRAEAVTADELELNLSNANAYYVLDSLGLEDLCGSLSAEDFLGRILLAEAIAPKDEGMPAYTEGILTHCGREEGYLGDKLALLREIASQAHSKGLQVVWA
jgi:hypothetical protein